MNNTSHKLQAVLQVQIGKGNVHSVVAAVQSNDRRIDFAGSAGIADPVTGTKMTADTPYFLASITKVYTAAIVLRLYQEKRLDLDAPISQYLSSNIPDGGMVSTAPESVTFLRAFFEGVLFDKVFFKRMLDWNTIFFPLRYGYGLIYFKLPCFFWIHPLPEFIGHSGSMGSFAFICPSRSIYIPGTLNQIASPARPFFLMINLVRAANQKA